MKITRKPLVTYTPLVHQGKVRDMNKTAYPAMWLMTASDGISSHNVVHKSNIPAKGYCLTAKTIFWLPYLEAEGIAHHIVDYGKKIFDYLPGKRSDYPKDLHLRAVIIEIVDPILYEFIWRGYLTGSLWKNYYSKGLDNPYGINLPKGLPLMHKFDEEIFTPTDKSDNDVAIRSSIIEKKYPEATKISLQLYQLGRRIAQQKKCDFVDFKAELGMRSTGEIVVIDEFLNGDSCREAKIEDIKEGQNPPWHDKQVIRDEAERIWAGGKKYPITFSSEVIKKGTEAYLKGFELMVGETLTEFQKQLS